ncbi:hypothetical protein LF887_01400 [Chryseobacterium sp. MEBOG06]|nr:hypothetical protein [Chryseobacterium sp. MEBOG06]UKB84338.1 hypothetical protein LF887_01400 [Chryseobacterium sp. MEBOG06]
MKLRKALLLLCLFQFTVILSQESCISMTINQAKNDSLNIRFTNKCKEEVALYQYNTITNTPLNKAYDFDSIALLEKRKYDIQNITVAQNHESPIDYQKVKKDFFILNPNESHEFTFPLLIFLKKHQSVYEKNDNYYLFHNKYEGKKVQFKLRYDAKIISEKLVNFENQMSLYTQSIKSNMIKVVLK